MNQKLEKKRASKSALRSTVADKDRELRSKEGELQLKQTELENERKAKDEELNKLQTLLG
jgi:hypothetical protein